MESKINFIFAVMLIFTILCIICFVYYLEKAIKEYLDSSKNKEYLDSSKNKDKKLYCNDCKLSYTYAPESKYCCICGKELQYINFENNNDSFNKE